MVSSLYLLFASSSEAAQAREPAGSLNFHAFGSGAICQIAPDHCCRVALTAQRKPTDSRVSSGAIALRAVVVAAARF